MVTISQFSKISGLTVKALRYYDEKGLLTPSCRDKENQYRYYDDQDLERALMIKFLRSLDFSIMEIEEILKLVKNQNDLICVLQEKAQHVESNIAREQKQIQLLRSHASALSTVPASNAYDIGIREIPEMTAACLRFQGHYSELDQLVPLLYKAAKNKAAGVHFNCYYDDDYSENADIELCLPVTQILSHPQIVCRPLPKIRALHTTHVGPYENLSFAYKALFDYINQHQLNIIKPIREVYVRGPGMLFRGNPAAYETEVFFPLEIL